MEKLGRFLGAFLSVILFMGIYSIAEEITLTTYYPAPYGAYEELTTTGNTYLATTSGNVGIGTTVPETFLHLYCVASNYKAIRIQRGLNYTDYDAYGQRVGVYDTAASIVDSFTAPSGQDITYSFSLGNTDAALPIFTIKKNGTVGIGTTAPTARLHVTGNIKAILNDIDGASPANMRYNSGTNEIGYDIAELFDTSEEVEIGDVLVIDEANNLKLRRSRSPYEKGVIGIVSGSPAILFEGSQLEIAPMPGGFTKGTKPPVALTGRIQCKVSIENGSIGHGDFLTTSSIPGHAMKALDREKSFGAIIGKALEPFNSGPNNEKTGKIIVLVTLQ